MNAAGKDFCKQEAYKIGGNMVRMSVLITISKAVFAFLHGDAITLHDTVVGIIIFAFFNIPMMMAIGYGFGYFWKRFEIIREGNRAYVDYSM